MSKKGFTEYSKLQESYTDMDYINTIDKLVDILEDNNQHSLSALVFSLMHDRNPDKTKKLFDDWYKIQKQGYL